MYMRLGAGPLKNKTELNVCNLFAKAVHFATFHQTGKAWRDQSGLVGVFTAMLRTGLIYPAAAFVMPVGGRGMDIERSECLFAALLDPHVSDASDHRAHLLCARH